MLSFEVASPASAGRLYPNAISQDNVVLELRLIMTKLEKTTLGMGIAVVILLGAAIVVPNLFRAKMAADPPPYGQGAWFVRTINTSQVTYSINFEQIGYAPGLAALGPASAGECGPEHACLLDGKLGCARGVGQQWCAYEGYRFNLQSSSTKPPYRDYWVTATPIEANPKLKNYCSAEDAVIHIESAAPLRRPYTRAECLAIPPDPDGYYP